MEATPSSCGLPGLGSLSSFIHQTPSSEHLPGRGRYTCHVRCKAKRMPGRSFSSKHSRPNAKTPDDHASSCVRTPRPTCLGQGRLWHASTPLAVPGSLTLHPGHFSFSFLAMPVMVPPVPAEATSMSSCPDGRTGLGCNPAGPSHFMISENTPPKGRQVTERYKRKPILKCQQIPITGLHPYNTLRVTGPREVKSLLNTGQPLKCMFGLNL